MPAPVNAPYGSKAYYSEIGRRGGLASAAARRAKSKSAIMTELQGIVADIAEAARRNASWSNQIPRAIQTGTVQDTGEGIECDITVDLGIAPQARAFEYGSGIWGSKGKKYPITAKNEPLAFQFSLSAVPRPEKFIRMAGIKSDGMLAYLIGVKGSVSGLTFWHMVEHPGVEARPYLKPAIDEVLPTITERLGKAFIISIQGMFNEAE